MRKLCFVYNRSTYFPSCITLGFCPIYSSVAHICQHLTAGVRVCVCVRWQTEQNYTTVSCEPDQLQINVRGMASHKADYWVSVSLSTSFMQPRGLQWEREDPWQVWLSVLELVGYTISWNWFLFELLLQVHRNRVRDLDVVVQRLQYMGIMLVWWFSLTTVRTFHSFLISKRRRHTHTCTYLHTHMYDPCTTHVWPNISILQNRIENKIIIEEIGYSISVHSSRGLGKRSMHKIYAELLLLGLNQWTSLYLECPISISWSMYGILPS